MVNEAIEILKDMALTFTGKIFLFLILIGAIVISINIIGYLERKRELKKIRKKQIFEAKLKAFDKRTGRYYE